MQLRPLSLLACLVLALASATPTAAAPPCPHSSVNTTAFFPFPGPLYDVDLASRLAPLPFPSPASNFGLSPFASAPAAAAAAAAAGIDVGGAGAMGGQDDDVPYPFTRVLEVGSQGNDVVVLQGLLRQAYPLPEPDGQFGATTKTAVTVAQEALGLPVTGRVEARDARAFLKAYSFDAWKDPLEPSDGSWKYKILIYVSTDRTKETRGMLLGPDNTVHHHFTARVHGHSHVGEEDWPEWDSENPGLNQFTSNGNTPTGLGWVDLNSPFAPEIVRETPPSYQSLLVFSFCFIFVLTL